MTIALYEGLWVIICLAKALGTWRVTVGSLFSFRVGNTDAEVLQKEFANTFIAQQFVDPLLDKLIAREKQAVRGAKAEETVAEILKSLSSEHVVLHDIRAEWGNIDHLIFRKDGAVFLLETKSHGGQVTEVKSDLHVNGKPENFIGQAHRNIYWLREFLKTRFQIEPWISTAVVFTNAYVSVRRPLRGVSVINAKYLNRWIAQMPSQPLMSEKLWAEVEQIKSQLQLRN